MLGTGVSLRLFTMMPCPKFGTRAKSGLTQHVVVGRCCLRVKNSMRSMRPCWWEPGFFPGARSDASAWGPGCPGVAGGSSGGFTALSVAPMRCMGLQGFVGATLVAWDSLTPQRFVRGAMHCIGMGLTDTSSLKLQGEVGGWRRLSGVHRCVSRKTHTHTHTHTHLTSRHGSPPVCTTACVPARVSLHSARPRK